MRLDAEQQTEFLRMLRRNETVLVRMCLFFTRQCPDDFNDLYQEIVCNLCEAWPRFRGGSTQNTWVMSIALNVAVGEYRKRRRMPDFVVFDVDIHDIVADESTDRRYQSLYRIIDSLEDDDDRKLLFLYIDRHPLLEIAQATGTTEAAVKQRIYRLKQQLKELNKRNSEYEE